MKSILITLLLCFSCGLIQQANAVDQCDIETKKLNDLRVGYKRFSDEMDLKMKQREPYLANYRAALASKNNRNIYNCKNQLDQFDAQSGLSSYTTVNNKWVNDIEAQKKRQERICGSLTDAKGAATNSNQSGAASKTSSNASKATIPPTTSTPPASEVIPSKPNPTGPKSATVGEILGSRTPRKEAPTAPKSATVGTVAPTPAPATTTSTSKAPNTTVAPTPATTTSTPTQTPASPNTMVPQNEAQKKELELRQMQMAEAIKSKQAPATTPSPYSSFGTAPASATNPSSATNSNSTFGTAPVTATNPSSAAASNPTVTPNPAAAPKTGGYGSNTSTTTTTTSTPAASSAPSISGAQSYSIPGVDMSMLTIQQQKRVKDDCGNDAGCANRWIANFKTSNGLRDVKREQQIKQNRQDSLDAVYKNSGPVKKAWMVLSKANQEDVAYIMSGSVPILKEDFQKLCIKESSTENYNFIDIWLKQRQFNNVTKEWSQATYNRFIGAKPSASPFDGAPAPMNLGTEELKLVNRDIETNGYVSYNTYEAIYQRIRTLFQNDTYKRWVALVEKNER